MFYGQNNNNTNDAVSTNTTIIPLYSELSSLTLGAWNDKITVKFNPAIGKDGNGLTQYDREKKISTALTQVNACLLLSQIDKKIIPMINGEVEKEPISIGILIGKNESKNNLKVEYKPCETGEYRLYLTFKQSDGNEISFIFNQSDITVENNGEMIATKEEGEFLLFVNILKNHQNILPLTPHAIRHSDEIRKRYSSNNNQGNNNSSYNSQGGYNSAFDYANALPFN